MPSARLSGLLASVLLVGAAALGPAPSAHAAGTITWSGGGDDALWTTGANWVGGNAPTEGDDLVFPDLGSPVTTVNDFSPGTTFSTLTFHDTEYTTSGNALALTYGLNAMYTSGQASIDLDLNLPSVYVDAGGTLALTGALTGPTLDLTGGGRLLVGGSVAGSVTVNGGTLGGTGSLQGAGISGGAGTTVDPGPADRPGILSYTNGSTLAMPSGSTLHIDLDGLTVGTGYDRLALTGGALFNPNGATLRIDPGYLPTVNSSFQIVSQTVGTPISGRFNGLSQFGSFTTGQVTYSIGYFNSGIVLTVVATDRTVTWDGGGATNNWSDAANWDADRVPLSGSDLVFPAGAARMSSVNDLPSGFDVGALTIAAAEYMLTGNSLDLGGTLTASYAAGTSTVDLDLGLAGARTVDVAAGGTLVLPGVLSGPSDLTKTSGGTLRMDGASSYAGQTMINAGTLSGSGTVPNLGLAPGTSLAAVLDQTLSVTGSVTLYDTSLSLTVDSTPDLGEVFTVLANDGDDAVTGNFTGRPEGALVEADGTYFAISYAGGSGNDVMLTAVPPPTTTVLTSSGSPTVHGEEVTFTATVSSKGAPVPEGTVRFLVDDEEAQAAAEVDDDGVVTFTTGDLEVGDSTVTAEYAGTDYAASDDELTHTVGQATSTTELSVPAGPLTAGADVTLTATVAATSPGAGTPTGTVTFWDGTTELDTVELDDGEATLTTDELSAGTRELSATYEGDDDFTGSTSTTVEREVEKVGTAVSVAATAATVRGQSVTFTATATTPNDEPVPAGTIRFLLDGTEVQAAEIVDAQGRVTFTTATLTVGDHTVTAEYAGTAVLADDTDSTTHHVSKAATTTGLSIGAGALTANVQTVAPGSGVPTGKVVFTVGGTEVGTSPLTDGTATLAHVVVPGTSVSVVATYAGSADHSGSTTAVQRTDPTLTAATTSAKPRSRSGWYRSPVQVTFSCTPGTGALSEPCPAPVLLTKGGRGLVVTRTVSAADGGAATASVTVDLDRTKPKVSVKQTKRGLRCQARDRLSGVASCKLTTKRRAGGVVTYVARAKDRAGNVATLRGRLR